MENEATSSLAIWVGFGGVFLGAAIASISNYFINKSNQKSEERKHLATLTVNAAVENWKRLHEGRSGEHVLPFDIYLVHMAKLSQEILSGDISKTNVSQKLKNVDDIVEEMYEYANQHKKAR